MKIRPLLARASPRRDALIPYDTGGSSTKIDGKRWSAASRNLQSRRPIPIEINYFGVGRLLYEAMQINRKSPNLPGLHQRNVWNNGAAAKREVAVCARKPI